MGKNKNCDMLKIAKYSIFTDNTRQKQANMAHDAGTGGSHPSQFESLRPLETGAGRKAQIQWTGSKNSVPSSDANPFARTIREQMIIQEIDENSSCDKYNTIVATGAYSDPSDSSQTSIDAALFTVTGATGRFRGVKWVLINYQNGQQLADGTFTNKKNRELHFIKRQSDRDALMKQFNGQPAATFLGYSN